MKVKAALERAAHAGGAVRWIRYRNRARARILMYHRFPGPAGGMQARLSRECEHLRRYYHPVSLSQIGAALRGGEALPANAIAITVDDGYADFADAFPIFRGNGLPVTLYAVSAFISREVWLWPDRLHYLIAHTPLGSIRAPLPGGESVGVTVGTPEDRYAAFEALCQPLIRAPNAERLRILEELPAAFETAIPREIPGEYAPLTWEQLRNMAADGLDVGCHTHTHPIVSRLEREHDLKDEIAGAKRRIEEKLGAPVRNFCYPNGTRLDFNDASVAAVKSAGFETAVVTERALVRPGDDVFRLPRIGVEPDSAPLYFERCAAGFRA